MRHPRRPALGWLAALALAAAALVPAAAARASTAAAWSQTINVHAYSSGGTEGKAVAVGPDGSTVYAAGTAVDSNYAIAEIAAYNHATGATVWQTRYSPGNSWNSGFSGITVSPSGATVFVTGHSGKPGTLPGQENLIVAYSAATGAKLWQVSGPPGTYGPEPISVSPDSSTVYVTCADTGQTVAYNAATGATRWTSPSGGDAMALSTDGTTVFVARSYPTSGADGLIDALDAATGATIWSASYGRGAELTSATLSADGSTLFVAGTTPNPATGKGRVFVTAAYSASSGTQLWNTQTGSKKGYSTMIGLAASGDGSAVVVSETVWPRKQTGHWVTLGLNPATGAIMWTRTLWGSRAVGAQNNASAITASGSTAYVTGWLWGVGTKGDQYYATVGYDATTGAPVFSADYRGYQNDAAFAVAASPDGSMVFVTGTRGYPSGTPNGGHFVMTTVGYNT
jgi:outer membrane protein assembly factor BamB